MQNISIRLLPGSKLKESIYELAEKHNIKAGIILTCLGSLHKLNIRLAGANNNLTLEDSFEILSLTGTFNNAKQGHFHISVADKEGVCLGGHLLNDNIVATTVELVIANIPNISFQRILDNKTGYLELEIKSDIP